MGAFVLVIVAAMLMKLGILNSDLLTTLVGGGAVLFFGAILLTRIYDYVFKNA